MFLAIMWTVVLALDIITCVLGFTPTWLMVFGPLVVVVVDHWIKYFTREE